MASQVFTGNGTFTWPTGITEAIIESVGGGGGGGGENGYPSGGGGGKGGGYSIKVLTKGGETTLAVTVGVPGTAGSGGNGGDGGASYVQQGGSTICLATGGQGGGGATSDNHSGTGGTSEIGGPAVGDTSYAGGNGGTGNGADPGGYSGGGGGAAGPTSVGNPASGQTQGTKGSGTFRDATVRQGDGANGRTTAGAGAAGSNYGGGGSGGLALAAANRAGGAGAAGIVVISWALREPLKLSESAAAERQATADLSRDVGTDGLKVTESAVAAFDLAQDVGTDGLKVSEAVTAELPLARDVGAESLKLQDTGNGRTALLGWIHITESAAAERQDVSADLSRDVGTDGLNVTESVSAILDPLIPAIASDSLKASESATASMAELSAVPTADSEKLSESVTVLLDPLAVSVADSLKVSDPNPQAQRIEPGELTASATETLKLQDTGNGRTALLGFIHVTESAQAEMGAPEGGDLSRAVDADGLKVTESAAALLSPLIASIGSDGLKASESVAASLPVLLASPANEGVKVSESVAALLPVLIAAVGDTTLKVSDTLVALLPELVTTPADDGLKVGDTTPVGNITDLQDLAAAPQSEGVKVSESAAALLDPIATSVIESLTLSDENPSAFILAAGDLAASAAESLKLQDTGNGRTALLGVIHVADVAPTAERIDQGGDNLYGSPEADGLILSDAAAGALSLLQVSAAETLLLLDGSDSWAALFDIEPIHVTESVQAELISAADLSRNVGTEGLKASESATALLSPLVASLTENLKAAESVNASFGLAATAQESLKASEQASARLDPLQGSATDGLKASESVTNIQRTDFGELTVDEAENIKVSEAPTLRLTPLQGSPAAESAHVTEGVAAVLSPLRASKSDSLKIGEDLAADRIDAGELTVSRTELLHVTESATGTLAPLLTAIVDAVTLSEQVIAGIELSANVSESLKVSDAVTQTSLVAVNTLTADVADSLRIAETLGVCLDPLVATASESVIVTDEASAGTDLLQAVISDSLKMSDQVDADANILVRPIDLMGTDVAYFDLQGTDARTMDYTVTLE